MYGFIFMTIDDLIDWGADFATGVMAFGLLMVVVMNALYLTHHYQGKEILDYVSPLIVSSLAVTILGSVIPFAVNLMEYGFTWNKIGNYLEPALMVAACAMFLGLLERTITHALVAHTAKAKKASKTEINEVKVVRNITWQFGALYLATFLFAEVLMINNENALATALFYFLPGILIAASIVCVGELWHKKLSDYAIDLLEINFGITILFGILPFLGMLAFYDNISTEMWSLYLKPALFFGLVGFMGGFIAAVLKEFMHFHKLKKVRGTK